MSEMFTEEDAENDGLIKREVGQQLNGVLSRKSGKLYTKFRQWCEENDRDPANVLGDLVLRSMRDEGFAQELSGTVVDIAALNRQQIREEDLELVTGLINRFDDGDDGGDDPIEGLIEQRIQAIGSGPMGQMGDAISPDRNGGNKDQKIQRLEREIQRLNSKVEDDNSRSNGTEQTTTTETTEETQDVDDLFGNGSNTKPTDDDDSGEDNGDSGSSGADTVETVDLGHDEDDSEEEEVIPTFSSQEADEE